MIKTTELRSILASALFFFFLLIIVFCGSIFGLSGFTFDQDAYNKIWNDETEIWFGQSTALTGQTKE